MASRFEIINNALVITDTSDSSVSKDFPARDIYYNSAELDNGNIVLYDTNSINELSSVVFRGDLADAEDSGGTSFTATSFRTFCRENLGFSSASGGSGARTTNVLNGSPFADFAALETYSQANLSELINSNTEVAIATVTGLAVYEWAGEDTPASYTNSWVVRVNLENPTDMLTEDNIPVMGATQLVDSGIRKQANGNFFFPGTPEFESASIRIGDITTLSESNSFLLLSNTQFTATRFGLIDARQRTTGESSRPRQFYLTEAENDFSLQNIDTETITANPLTVNYTTTLNAQTNSLMFRTGAPMTNVRVAVRYNTAPNAVVKYIPSKDAWENETNGLDFTAGDNTIDFPSSPFRFFTGDEVEIELRADNVSLLGDTNDFPYLQAKIQRGEFRNIAYEADIVQSDWNETDTNSDAFILNKPTIPTSRTDEEIRDVVAAQLVAGDNITLTEDDVANTITIASTGGGGDDDQNASEVLQSNTNQNGILTTAANVQVALDRIDNTGLGASARVITSSFNCIWSVGSENTNTWFGNRQNVRIEVRPAANNRYTFTMPDFNDTNSMFDALAALGLGEEYTITLIYLGGNTGFVNRNRLTINNASTSHLFPRGTFPTVLAQGQSATFRVSRNGQWERLAFEQAVNPAPTLGEVVLQDVSWNNADGSFLPSAANVLQGYAFPVIGSNPNDGTLRQGLLDAGVSDRIIYDGDYVIWTGSTFTSWADGNDWFVLPRNQLQEVSREESNFLAQTSEIDNRVDLAPVSMLTNDALVWLSENPLAEAPFLLPSTDPNNPRAGDDYPYVGGREDRNGMSQFQLSSNRFNNYMTIGITPNFFTGHNLRDIEVRIYDTDRTLINNFNLQDDFALVDDATFTNSTVRHYQRATSVNYPFLATIEIWLTQVQQHFRINPNTVDVTQNIPQGSLTEIQLDTSVQEKLNRAIPPQGVSYASIEDRLSPYANITTRTPVTDARYFASDGTETYPSSLNEFSPVPANNPVFEATETILFVAVPEPGSFILKNLTASSEVALDNASPNVEVVESFTDSGTTYFVYRVTSLTVGHRFEVERVETQQVVAWQNDIDNLEDDINRIDAELEHAVLNLPDDVVQVLENEVSVTEESNPTVVATDYNDKLAGSSNTTQTVFYEPSPNVGSGGIKNSKPLSDLTGDQVRRKLLYIPPSTPVNQQSYITAFDGTTGRDLISYIQGQYLVNVRVPAQPASTITSTIYPAPDTRVSGAGIWQNIPALTFVNGIPVAEADELFFTRNVPSDSVAITIDYRGHANGNVFGTGQIVLAPNQPLTTFNLNDGSETVTVEVLRTNGQIRVSETSRVNSGLPTVNDVEVILSYTESRTIPATSGTTRQVPIAHLDANKHRVFAFKPLSNGNLGVVSDETEIDTNRSYETWFGATLGGHISIVDDTATFLNYEDFEPITTTVSDLENHATLPQFGLFTTEYTHDTIVTLDTQLRAHNSEGDVVNLGQELVLVAPDSTRWRLSVDNSGNLSTTQVT